MKLSRIVSSLHNSTKATVIACSVLLVMTTAVLFFLMLFPIKMRDRSAALSAPVIAETTTTPETLPEAAFTTTTKEPPHTLSTWAATIETLETTLDPDETTDIPWYDKLFTTTVETDEYGSTVTTTSTEETTTSVYLETEPPYIETEIITEMITIPETVPETPPQTFTEVVVTQPPETEAEIINAEPVAPDFGNE